jgi:hypothetical protein
MVTPLKLQKLKQQSGPGVSRFLEAGRLADLLETARQEGFDHGIRATRDELEAGKLETTARLSETLSDRCFTHSEVRRALLASLEPLIEQMVALMLPGLARDGLIDVVKAEVLSLAGLLTDGPVQLTCHPELVSVLRSMLSDTPGEATRIQVSGAPEFDLLKVTLVAGAAERSIDIPRALADVRAKMAGFFQHTEEERALG